MKRLLDQNLSPRLVDRLASMFPGISHVSLVGLGRAVGADVWAYARIPGFTIITKDADYSDISVLRGFPEGGLAPPW